MSAASQPARDARTLYNARCRETEAAIAALDKRHIQIGNFRLLVFVLACTVLWLWLRKGAVGGWALALPVIAFIVLLFLHERILRSRRHQERILDLYRQGLARMDHRWSDLRHGETDFMESPHPYATDLDLFGRVSLFQLVSVARTSVGKAELASWLQNPATSEAIRLRQPALRELAEKLDFRQRMATAGDEVLTERAAMNLPEWGAQPKLRPTSLLRITAAVLSVIAAIAIFWFALEDFLWLAQELPRPPVQSLRFLLGTAAVNGIFALWLRRGVRQAVDDFEGVRNGLGLVASILQVIESERFESPLLAEIQHRIGRDATPSTHLHRLNRLADLLDSRDNLLVRIFGPPLLWTTQVALGIEAWRARYGDLAAEWVAAVKHMEALNSLATYTFEHQDNVFPEIAGAREAVYEADSLAHPLLTDPVANSILLNAGTPLWIISGSNMSGKSTLLRTIGINAVLAFAGAPVRARRMRLSPFSIGASLRVADSLGEGDSHFFAEIKRIRLIVDQAEQRPPALFLIDEILQGTNSQDRLTGTKAILERLLASGALGAITTHDLALTKLVAPTGALPGNNYHLEDQVRDGKMTFDYRLRPGVVTGSNAVELMRLYNLVD